MALAEGNRAPEFQAAVNGSQKIALKDFLGKKRVVLYFYPKDDTPGCTVEACGFRDKHAGLEKTGAVILGVSPDDAASHERFIKKFTLPFTLLSDEDKAIAKAYGVWIKKSMYGKEYMGVARTTFIIGKDGKIEKIFEKVKPDGHNDEVQAFLQSAP